MNGVEMMLKSFGLDPDKIKMALESAKQQAELKLAEIEAKLVLIDQRVSACHAQLEDVERQNNKIQSQLAVLLHIHGIDDPAVKVVESLPTPIMEN